VNVSPCPPPRIAATLPARAGVGFKPEHFNDIRAARPNIGFFEVHAENYMGDGGPPHRRLEALRADYPLSLHGVALSIGSPRPLDREHLRRLAALAKRVYEARSILVLAGDLAESLAHYFEYQLGILALPIVAATSAGRIAHLTRGANKQDLVFAISFRRGLRQTVEGAQLARSRGAYCVGITDTYLSPLAQECHEVFLASIESPSFIASYTAPIALFNAILATCGEFRRERTLSVARAITEEQRAGSRWYGD